MKAEIKTEHIMLASWKSNYLHEYSIEALEKKLRDISILMIELYYDGFDKTTRVRADKTLAYLRAKV